MKTFTIIIVILIIIAIGGFLGWNLFAYISEQSNMKPFTKTETIIKTVTENEDGSIEVSEPTDCPEMEVVYQQDEALFLCQEVFKENEELKTTNEELETEIGLLELAQKTDKEKMNELEIDKNEWWQKNYKCQEQLEILIN